MIVDLAIIGFGGFWFWRGLRRGLIVWAVNTVGFVAAVAAAAFGYRAVAGPLREAGFSEAVSSLGGALLIFLAVMAATFVGGRALSKVVRLTRWGLLDRAGGGVAAGGWALAWITVVLLAVTVIPVPAGVSNAVDGSRLATGIVDGAPGFLQSFARTDYRRLLTTFMPQPHDPVLTAATTDFRNVSEAERALFDLANDERRARGLAALRWDERLARVARAHAADMYRRGYFSHRSPDGVDVAGRLEASTIAFSTAGENLALAPTIGNAHNQLMRSKEHRAHILGERFERVGVGVMLGRQGYVAVQEFVV